MRPTLFKLTAFLLILAGVLATCKKPDDPNNPVNPPTNYSVDIPFEEYSLGTQCQWENLPYDGKIMIINSKEELEQYINCTGGAYHAIDFSKNSLLLAHGTTNSGITEITVTNLQQLSSNQYSLNMEITTNDDVIAETWCKALIVEKMKNESNVALNIIEYPIDIPFEEYALEGTQCQWKHSTYNKTDSNKVIVINSNDELGDYIFCIAGSFPTVDFSTYSMIYARGWVPSSHAFVKEKLLRQISGNEYSFYLTVRGGPLHSPDTWNMAIVIPKLSENAIVNLYVTVPH
jgi:hypothetical protein